MSMKITPLEIRQKSFEKGFRGYDKDEVDAFLRSLSKEWERMQDEFKEVKIKYEAAQKEVEKLREVESSLFKTLKTAEDTGANMIEQANRSAELHLKETQVKSEALMNEAKSNAKGIIEKAEAEAREIIERMQEEVKALEQTFYKLQDHRDTMLSELRNLSNDTMERVDKLSQQKKYQQIDEHLKMAREIGRQSERRNKKEEEGSSEKEEIHEDTGKETTVRDNKKNAGSESFFDQIE